PTPLTFDTLPWARRVRATLIFAATTASRWSNQSSNGLRPATSRYSRILYSTICVTIQGEIWASPCRQCSMKVPALAERQLALRGGLGEVAVGEPAQLGTEVDEALRHHVHDEAGALQPAAHGDEARGHDDAPVLREHLRPHDDVGDVGLVLQG